MTPITGRIVLDNESVRQALAEYVNRRFDPLVRVVVVEWWHHKDFEALGEAVEIEVVAPVAPAEKK